MDSSFKAGLPRRVAPLEWPTKAEHHGSLTVTQKGTCSPSASATTATYSAKRCAVSRLRHPPGRQASGEGPSGTASPSA